ncbi:MAG TPA: efflux RND transporter periplasmic adaptor subunit [Clostridiaceae bacterium]
MKKRIFAIIVILIVILGFVRFRMSIINKNKYTIVKTTPVITGDIKSYLSTTANIKSKNYKDYYALTGKVTALNIKVGDLVKKGQVMVNYQVNDLSTPVTQAQIAYNNAVSAKNDAINTNNINTQKLSDYNYDQLINDYTNQLTVTNSKISQVESEISRLQNSTSSQDKATVTNDQLLLNTGISQSQPSLYATRDSQISQLNATKSSKSALGPISAEKLNQLSNSILTAKASLDAAKSNLAKNVDSITADFDGTVTVTNVLAGQNTSIAIVAVTVQDLSSLEGYISVGKYDAAKLSLNEPVVFTYNTKNYNGKVAFMDPAAKTSLGATDATIGVNLDITDKVDGLKVGFDADVNILLGQVNSVIKIPEEAIKSDKTGRDYVYIVENKKAVENTVKLGLESDTEAQILDGVKVGDKVILNPVSTLKNGALVK